MPGRQVTLLGLPVMLPVPCHRETDENISEPQFINLSYVQAQHDYLAGNYPVVREDAAQVSCLELWPARVSSQENGRLAHACTHTMSAGWRAGGMQSNHAAELLGKGVSWGTISINLSQPMLANSTEVAAVLWGCGVVAWCPQMASLQVHAEYGPGLDAEDPEGFSAALERFITRQVLMTRPKDEWRGDVAARCAQPPCCPSVHGCLCRGAVLACLCQWCGQSWPAAGWGCVCCVCCMCSSCRLKPCNSFLPKNTRAFGHMHMACRYKVLAQQTKEDARCAFMRILRTLPYGNATFFAVRRIGECCRSSRRPARQQTSLPALLVGGSLFPARCLCPLLDG